MLNEEQDLLPVEQQTLTFYGKPIVVVRLPGGQPGVVLRFLCENLQIDTAAQTQRIRRTEQGLRPAVVSADLEWDSSSFRRRREVASHQASVVPLSSRARRGESGPG
jgi:hypothetical protein